MSRASCLGPSTTPRLVSSNKFPQPIKCPAWVPLSLQLKYSKKYTQLIIIIIIRVFFDAVFIDSFFLSLFFFYLELFSVGQLLTPRLAIAGSSSHPLHLTWAINEYAGEDNALESKPLDKRGSGFWLVILYYLDDAVDIDKDHSKEKSKVCLFRASYSKRASHLACLWQRQWRGGALRWKKGKLQVCPDWGLLTWGSGRGLTRSSHSMPLVRDVVIGLFLVARRDRN